MSDWIAANQHHLTAALGVLTARLERRSEDEAQRELAAAAAAMPAPAALDRVSAAFGLTEFERDVLLLCAAPELDGAFAERFESPSFSFALASLPGAHWSAVTPSAPLRYWRLVTAGPDAVLTGPLRISERALHFLAGAGQVDERLEGQLTQIVAGGELPPSQRAVADALVALWATSSEPPVIALAGAERWSRRAVAALACEQLGLALHTLAAADIPATAPEREELARMLERETALIGTALMLELDDDEDANRALSALAERLRGATILSGRDPLSAGARASVTLDVELPTTPEQRALWSGCLDLDGAVDSLVAQFRLDAREIQLAAAEARARATSPEQLGRCAWDACRRRARPQLDDLATRIAAPVGWDDLVLPPAQLDTLRDVVRHVRGRARVYEAWGFGSRDARGLGISVLFHGSSGTGKTLAAEVLAAELELDLYRIDLSQVVSKYVGETEKNLRRVFDSAERGGAVLLFDEADALFGKRTEVKDSHDRYANIEVSYLLQRMEAYRGLAILTTNQKSALDAAFLRRLRFVVHFPFPDAAQRERIWARAFPAATPTAGLDPTQLARLNVAGGNIRNIALGAAFLAADADGDVTMARLLAAARSECAKIERPLSEAEIGGWR